MAASTWCGFTRSSNFYIFYKWVLSFGAVLRCKSDSWQEFSTDCALYTRRPKCKCLQTMLSITERYWIRVIISRVWMIRGVILKMVFEGWGKILMEQVWCEWESHIRQMKLNTKIKERPSEIHVVWKMRRARRLWWRAEMGTQAAGASSGGRGGGGGEPTLLAPDHTERRLGQSCWVFQL